jgi:hypothetical protein
VVSQTVLAIGDAKNEVGVQKIRDFIKILLRWEAEGNPTRRRAVGTISGIFLGIILGTISVLPNASEGRNFFY